MIIKNDIVNKNEEGLKVADKMCEFKIQELGLRNYRRFDKKICAQSKNECFCW